jgi:cyclopropane fatty-acyl-phospholipid synthase-like methyltransferase
MALHKKQTAEDNVFINPHYLLWRAKRIKKIESIFEPGFFKGKTILELGCGHGHIGKYFREELGAVVTFSEGRIDHHEFIARNNPGAEIVLLDQEYDWSLGRKFDLVLHFGVSYHLVNWRQDLRCATEHTNLIIFESLVANSLKPDFKRCVGEINAKDQSINPHKIGTRASAAYIESEITRNGFTFERYDDPDLNSASHTYDWICDGSADAIPEEEYDQGTELGLRRFWIFRNGIQHSS